MGKRHKNSPDQSGETKTQSRKKRRSGRLEKETNVSEDDVTGWKAEGEEKCWTQAV